MAYPESDMSGFYHLKLVILQCPEQYWPIKEVLVTIAQTVRNSIEAMPAGRIFGYPDLSGYPQSSAAVIKAVGRLVADKRLVRYLKGKFYVPGQGLMGVRKPSDSERIRTMLYKDGRLRGYVTGLSLYNQLGLTTQLPETITLALNGGRQEKDLGTIRVKTVITRIPIKKADVKLLQYLDVLRDIKKIPDSSIDQSLRIMRRYVAELSGREQARLVVLAESYYGPQTRALTGLLFSSLKLPLPESLSRSLNPTTVYKLDLDEENWPMSGAWNIRQ